MSLTTMLQTIRDHVFATILHLAIRLLYLFRYGQLSRLAHPDEVIYIPSRERSRKIKAHVYNPIDSRKPSPLLLNFHGSGFIFPLHGADDYYCRLVSSKTSYTVIDVQYRLAPWHPFPAALHDVEDVLSWALKQPGVFDPTQIALSGFSAGGNFVLSACSAPLLTNLRRDQHFSLSALIAVYPVTNLSLPVSSKKAPSPKGKEIPAWLADIFNTSYLAPEIDRRDPCVSPSYADTNVFPDNVVIFSAEEDSLAPEAEELGRRIASRDSSQNQVLVKRFEGCHHAWDKQPVKERHVRARDEAYALIIDVLKE